MAPNGKIFFGAWNRYNYAEGHLMQFDVGGGVPTGPPDFCLAVAK